MIYLRDSTKDQQHEEVTDLNDVIEAWNGIERAQARYRATVRAAIADGTKQAEIAKALDRTREAIRRDAMPEKDRQAFLAAEAERLRRARATRQN